MQQTLSYSSSPSPTLISAPIRPRSTTDTATAIPVPVSFPIPVPVTVTATPAIISVDYSYDPRRIMSPSTHSNGNYTAEDQLYMENKTMTTMTSSQLNQPYSSLFGDPVPPPQPEDYFGTAAFETIHASSIDMPSSEEDTLVAAVALNALTGNESCRRLFSNVPYCNTNTISTCRSQPLPRLQPPDIQILPNSSAGSSGSDQLDSPNFMLLTPLDNVSKPVGYDNQYDEQATQVSEEEQEQQQQQSKLRPRSESYASSGLDWYRPVSQHFAEFSRIPKLRPSSKMVMSIKHEEMPLSPLATMLQDSTNSSSSGDDQLQDKQMSSSLDRNLILSPKQYLQQQQQRELLRELNERQLIESMRSYGLETPISHRSHHSLMPESSIERATPDEEPEEQQEDQELEELQSHLQTMSPVVIKDSVSTGGDYRVGDTRLHKKSSFTILSVRSPKSSPQRTDRHPSIQSTTTSSQAPAQTAPQLRPRRKSLAGMRLPQLPLPAAPTDDSPRPSVQFNMSGRYSPNKLAMPTKGILQQRDSLTSSVDTTYTPRIQRRGSTFGQQRIKSLETLPLITDAYLRSAIPRFHRSNMELDKEPAIIPPGSLPRPFKPNPNPTRKQRGLLSIINKEEKEEQDRFSPLQPRSNWLSLDDLTLEQRLRKSAFDPRHRRRSSSTSPERRSSTQTASDRRSSNLSSITTSDFSFRRPTLSTLPATTTITGTGSTAPRRKSIYQTPKKSPRRKSITSMDLKQLGKRTKIAKPSTLSPIIGTPNKDSGKDSPLHGDAYEAAHLDTASELSLLRRRDSTSRIPVRNSPRDSLPNSRSTSPLKDPLSTLSGRNSQASNSRSPSQATTRSGGMDIRGMDIRLTPNRRSAPASRSNSRLAQDNSRTDSRADSRANSRANSRAESRADSRANSRANSRAESRGDSRVNSRADSRANSRADSRADSRANSRADSRAESRLSVRSSMRSTPSISPAAGNNTRNSRQMDTTPNRRKSISTSPKTPTAKATPRRRMSPSPTAKRGKPSKQTPKETTSIGPRRNSRSRIPTRSASASKTSSPAQKVTVAPVTQTGDKAKGKKSAQTVQSRKVSPKAKLSSSKAESAKKKISSISKLERNGSKTPAKVTSKKPAKPQKLEQATATKTNGKSGLPKPLKRAGSQQSIKKPQTQTQPQENESSKQAKQKISTEREEIKAKDNTADSSKPLAMHVGNAVQQAADALPAVRSEVNATPSKGGGIQRQGSNMSTLVRMSSRLSLISNKKRGDSAHNRKVSTVPEQTTEAEVAAAKAASPPAATSSDAKLEAKSMIDSATSETLTDHLMDHKTHENQSGLVPDLAAGASPTPSGAVKPNESAVSRLDTADGSNALTSSPSELEKSPVPPTQPIEASISVLNTAEAVSISPHAISAMPEADNELANLEEAQAVNFEHARTHKDGGSREDFQVDDKRLSPDGQGGSTAGSGGAHAKTSSEEFLKDDVGKGRGCCRCCSTLCMRFRRSRCMRCCGRRKDRLHDATEEHPVLSSARSSATTTTTTQVEVIDETKVDKKKKARCCPKFNCCKSCKKKPKPSGESDVDKEEAKMSSDMGQMHQPIPKQQQQQGKCGMCLRKVFCCRSVNKVDPITGDETELNKCCFCIPCRRRRAAAAATDPKVAWRDPDRDPELGITATDAAVLEGSSVAPSSTAAAEEVTKVGCCKRFWLMLLCCRKKKPRRGSETRRQSIVAPPSEDTRRKLHNDLVEYTSKMKGAIPVLPLYLAWFCAFCNIIFPGLGTLLSGLFCLCVGIPRFSQFDSARARIGSFIINIIVAVSQFFCVLFCFVGWGWSIWWGTIMLKCAKKLSKIKKVERLELEEEQRQAELAAAAGTVRRETETAKT
ncbi:GH22678 [Drosophila grimshawi]|uniref:GH22678 n=1 Tax=Drosophila grimshawi TaxID=7222 RepID=B4JVG8_DROGR|nr:GH22678 [Drosophila grimshawi]